MTKLPSTAAQAAIKVAVDEAALLAQEFESLPIFEIPGVRDGALGIQNAAAGYASAKSDDARIDAALGAEAAYALLSASLPDEGHSEQDTGWATAQQIATMFGQHWTARVRLAFQQSEPDASLFCADPDYLRSLIALAGISQREAAEKIGIGHRLLKYYLTTPGAGVEARTATYPVQYALESLARA